MNNHYFCAQIRGTCCKDEVSDTEYSQACTTPSIHAGGSQKMISITCGSCQPQREPWPLDWLMHEQSIALALSINNSSHLTYTSALNSYLTFCKIHNFRIEPTQQTLSFFFVYMSAHTKPDSVLGDSR